MVLPYEAAQARDLGHARHRLQGVAHLEVLDRPEPVGQVARSFEGVLVDPADPRRVGPEARLGSGRQAALDGV